MTDNEFDKKIISKITKERLAPKPRWHFLLKNYVMWVAGGLALLIGAAAVSVMIYLFKHGNWELRAAAHKTFWEFFLLTLPYFWIMFLGLFIFIVYYNFKHTKKGYLYPLPFVVAGSILASLFLGLIFHQIGLGRIIDDALGRRAPFYGKVFNPQLDFWCAPEEGRLTGVVIDLESVASFSLLDPTGNDWQVLTEDGSQFSGVRVGLPVRVVGRVDGKNKFYAEIIRPAGLPGRGFFAHPRMRGGERFDCRLDNCRPPLFTPPGDPGRFRNKFNQ